VTGSPALAWIARGDLCAGCGGCALIAPGKITMAENAAGYLRPVQVAELDVSEERRLKSVCPGLRLEQEAAGRTDDVLWGPLIGVYTGHATDMELRRNASSGGVLSAVLCVLLARGQVDYVLQTAAGWPPYANATVSSWDAAAVFEAAGSRYAPSAPLEAVAVHLDKPGKAAFVGKPCDVAALRALARQDSRIDTKFPYMISFFCAGVPSLGGARALLAALGIAETDVAALRYRGDGWPGFATATAHDGTTARMSYAESWGGILAGRVQFRCKICPDGVGGFADIVCADAWKCDADGYPLFEEADGTSLMITRTATGQAILDAAVTYGAVEVVSLDPAKIAAMQPGQVRRKTALMSRLLALSVLWRPRPKYKGFWIIAAARRNSLGEIIKNFFGTIWRIFSQHKLWS